MRMEDTPYDVAMTRSKQELARRVVECDARIEALEAALTNTTAHLAAAISLLERTPKAKKAAASDTMFDIMLGDYRKALDAARAALAPEQDQ